MTTIIQLMMIPEADGSYGGPAYEVWLPCMTRIGWTTLDPGRFVNRDSHDVLEGRDSFPKVPSASVAADIMRPTIIHRMGRELAYVSWEFIGLSDEWEQLKDSGRFRDTQREELDPDWETTYGYYSAKHDGWMAHDASIASTRSHCEGDRA